jgi:hypothetical protein
MKKKLIILTLVLLLALALATPVFAHDAGPCSGSGHDYAQHHVVPNATSGMLGAGGHVPGEHHGFSACNPSGN